MREKKIFSKRTKALIVSFVILALMVSLSVLSILVPLMWNTTMQRRCSIPYTFTMQICAVPGLTRTDSNNWRGDCHVYDAELRSIL